MAQKRILSGNEIEWQGAGVYALVLDPKGKRGWYWIKVTEFAHVEAALQLGFKVQYIYECDTTVEES